MHKHIIVWVLAHNYYMCISVDPFPHLNQIPRVQSTCVYEVELFGVKMPHKITSITKSHSFAEFKSTLASYLFVMTTLSHCMSLGRFKIISSNPYLVVYSMYNYI